MKVTLRWDKTGRWWLLAALVVTCLAYWPGLTGGFIFDDYPNIVDNHGVQPDDASIGSLVRAALSSPSSEFKRPLASLSFAANFLVSGLDPYWMKLTNLVIHLLNGLVLFVLVKRIIRAAAPATWGNDGAPGRLAALITAGWLLLPINLTGVLYVVQRMESMANLFVLLGLLGYMEGRRRMLSHQRTGGTVGPFLLCLASIVLPVAVGVLAKETAVMLPLYAFLVEWILFGFRRTGTPARDWRLLATFAVTLLLPMLVGLAWILPHVTSPTAFSTRDFTLGERLLSEARIVVGYVRWTLVPTPDALSFYHDDYHVSTGWLTPWTTLASILVLAGMAWVIFIARRRQPLVALGLSFYLGCHVLTGTILPLELIYEHRNYFASIGLLLAIVPFLAAPRGTTAVTPATSASGLPMALPRHVALGVLMVFWVVQTATTAYAWGSPLRLSVELAGRAPESPRAQYELGRTYIVYSHYDPQSPFTELAYAPLERAMRLPDSSILPEQALIFMNARMGLPIKQAWWDSMIGKLQARKPGVQDESSLSALTQCARTGECHLSSEHLLAAFVAAVSHPGPSARLLASYSDFAWNILGDHALGLTLIEDAVAAKSDEPAYRITLVRMLIAGGDRHEAEIQLARLRELNIGGRLEGTISELTGALQHSAEPRS
jgi:hypothetical protein